MQHDTKLMNQWMVMATKINISPVVRVQRCRLDGSIVTTISVAPDPVQCHAGLRFNWVKSEIIMKCTNIEILFLVHFSPA